MAFMFRNKRLIAVAALTLGALLAPHPAVASIPSAIAHPPLTQPAVAAPSLAASYVLLYVAPDGSWQVEFCRNDPVNSTDPTGLSNDPEDFGGAEFYSGQLTDLLPKPSAPRRVFVLSAASDEPSQVSDADSIQYKKWAEAQALQSTQLTPGGNFNGETPLARAMTQVQSGFNVPPQMATAMFLPSSIYQGWFDPSATRSARIIGRVSAFAMLAGIGFDLAAGSSGAVAAESAAAESGASVFPKGYQGGPGAMWVNEGRGVWKLTIESADKVMRHARFGKFFRSKSDGLWWVEDTAGHGGSAFKVYRETGKGLEWYRDADQFGDFVINKHKSDVGTFIPWKEMAGAK